MLTVAVIPRVVDHLSEAALKCVTEVVDALIDPNFIELETVFTVASDLEDHLMENFLKEGDTPSEVCEITSEASKLADTIDVSGKAMEVVGKILDTMGVTVEDCKELMDTVGQACEAFTEVTIALMELGEALGVISEVEIPSGLLEVSGEDLKAVDEVWRAVTIVLVDDQFEVMGEVVGITDVA